MSSLSPKYFPNLTPLRGLAAIAVVLFHKVTIYSGLDPSNGGVDKIIDVIFNKGYLGVNFFFTLSGFLITYLLIREKQQKGKMNIPFFLLRRVLRIWPVYFIVVAFGFLVYPHLTDVVLEHDPVYFVSFLSNFDEILNGRNMSVHSLTVLWSVSIEEQFYIAWALVLGLFALHPRRHFPSFFLIILITSVTFRLAQVDNDRIMYYHTLSCISDMALGGLLAHSLIYRNPFLDSIKRMPKLMIVLIYAIGVGYCLTHNLFMKGDLMAFDRLVTGAFWCFIIAEQCLSENSFLKFDAVPGLKYLGKISYGIYAYHLIVFFFLNEMISYSWETSGMFMDLVVNTLLALILTIVVAGISYHFIERPLLRLKEHFR